MKFLILSQYYPPETGAPQNRLSSLAKNLAENGHDVEILTAMPNYPINKIFKEYKRKVFYSEKIDNIVVHRSWIYISNNRGIIARLLNYFSFVLTSIIKGLFLKSFDYIYCESPPLFLSYSAFTIAWFKKSKVIFNVSDLWPESAKKLNIVTSRFLLKLASRLESKSYKKSFLVTAQTQGIIKSINSRFPDVRTHWFPNGIDIDIYKNIIPDSDFITRYNLHEKKVFMYAGVLGHAQGLEVIIKAAKELENQKDIQFVIVGDGPLKEELINLNNNLQSNLLFIPNTEKETLLKWICSIYAFIVPLRNIDLFSGAIPSKIFEPLALSVPIILGVKGEAYELFINNQKCGLYFEPENHNELAKMVTYLSQNVDLRNELGITGKRYVNQQFNRKDLTNSFLNSL